MLENSTQVKRNDFLKIAAAFAMLIDHSAILPVFSDTDNYIIMRAIGRIAFPIFAYYIAVGFKNTHDFKKYLKRLLICAAISQIPYTLYFKNPYNLNIIFTFIIAVFVLYFIKNKWYYTAAVVALVPMCIDILFDITFFDYSTYGVITIAVFYIFMDKPYKAGMIFSAITLLFAICYSVPLQILSILSLPLIFLKSPIYVKAPKYFFYYFYPAHLMVLYIAGILIYL